jgi:glycosyltransferase involved in cell wall biosynthesis
LVEGTLLHGAGDGLSLVVPFLDEFEALPVAVERLCAAFDGLQAPWELVLVDDGSTDGSGQLADRLADERDEVRVVRLDGNRGYGDALQAGFDAARHPIVAYSDADLPVPPEEFVAALPLLADADLVVGRPRSHPVSRRRRFYSAGHRAVIRALFGLDQPDLNFSFKLMRAGLLDAMRLDARRGFIDCQLLLEARRLDARIARVEVDHNPRELGRSHFDSPVVAVRSLAEILFHWLRRRSG